MDSIDVYLDETQSLNYYKNDTFIFKDKKLETYVTMNGQPVGEVGNRKSEPIKNNTKLLVFISGETNPLLFLNDFEKCNDVKSDKDKSYKILKFVDDCHKGEFTKLHFNSDWAATKREFLNTYSLSFVQNKKKNLDVDFAETTSLRSFVGLKLTSLSTFTTLPFVNQIEMIMNDLPVEISKLFIVNEKMTGNKNEILDYCDAIQDLVEATIPRAEEHEIQESGQPSDRMEIDIFNFQSENNSISPRPGRGRGVGRGRRAGKSSAIGEKIMHKRPSKKSERLDSIIEDSESSDNLDFLQQIDNTSRSSWSE